MDKLKLIKMVFFADRSHLVKYGRPIVGGNYVSMKLGPVSSELKDYIDGGLDQKPPCVIEGEYNLVAQHATDEDWLSESDLEVLDEVYNEYKNYDSVKLAFLSHEYKAWINNQPPEGSCVTIPYEDFFEEADNKTMLSLIIEEQEIQ